ncbi:MAG: RNA polymerase sigma factor [Verrucomicrobia bacterium]|nr:MAG: RNA polymerase sigma factor [Verrucomicrobiota bacterium]
MDDDFDVTACLEKVRRDDQQACRELVEYLYPMVIRIVRANLPRRVLEEDLAQEIFLKMFRRMHQYHGKVPFANWVSRIAVTTCIDHLRAQKRRPELRLADLSEAAADTLMAVVRDTQVEDPARAVAARELLEKLLDTLGPTDRIIINMLDLQQQTLAEISAKTGWSETMIKVRAFRARRKLRRAFERLQASEDRSSPDQRTDT